MYLFGGFSGGSDSRVYLKCRRPRFNHWVGKIPCRRTWLPTWLFLVSAAAHRLLNPYCGMQNLSVAACGIQFPNQGRNPGPQCGVSASETPGKSSEDLFFPTNQL